MDDLRNKLIRRLKYLRSFVREKQAAGFEFENIPDFKFDRSLKTKKEIQRELNKANKWSAEKLYKQGTYATEYTSGEVIPATEYRRAKKEWKQRQGFIPDSTIVDWLYEQIDKLPTVRYFKGGVMIEITSHKDRFTSMLNDILMSIETKEEENRVKEYFLNNQSIIVDSFAVVTHDSKEENVRSALARAQIIIQGRAMTPDESNIYSLDNINADYDVTSAAEYLRKVMQSPYARL